MRPIREKIDKDKVDKIEKVDKEKTIEKEEIKKKPKPRLSASIIDSFLGKDVIINLRGGNNLQGKLESVAQYELILTMSYKPVIVMKHAIDYIELSE